mgnify:CR=1 FL=1
MLLLQLAFCCGKLLVQSQHPGGHPDPPAAWGRLGPNERAGVYHHHIGLNTWESRGGEPPAAGDVIAMQSDILDHCDRMGDRFAVLDSLRNADADGVRFLLGLPGPIWVDGPGVPVD